MSPCPKCGQERGLHLRMVVPWDPRLPATIDHQCRSRKCGHLWSEVMHSPELALKSALENRGNAPLAGDLLTYECTGSNGVVDLDHALPLHILKHSEVDWGLPGQTPRCAEHLRAVVQRPFTNGAEGDQ